MILGLDTASSLSSVALIDGGEVVASGEAEGARRHAEALAPMLAHVLRGVEPGQIGAVACDVGPGPYSGLRVAIASAIACGLAWNVPVLGICSLDAVAAAILANPSTLRFDRESRDQMQANLKIDEGFGVALDARRNEVYWARYSAEGVRLGGPRVGRRDSLDDDLPWIDGELPHAAWVARVAERELAAGVRPVFAEVPLAAHGEDGGGTAAAIAGRVLLPPRPLYLRRPDVTVNAGATR